MDIPVVSNRYPQVGEDQKILESARHHIASTHVDKQQRYDDDREVRGDDIKKKRRRGSFDCGRGGEEEE